MKTLILYTSRHGSTKEVVLRMAKELKADSVDLHENSNPSLVEYERILIGGPIYLGSLGSALESYMQDHMDLLLQKQLGLFLLCVMNEERAASQFNHCFPSRLLAHSSYDGFFGGILKLPQMNWIEKAITFFAFRKKSQQKTLNDIEIRNFLDYFRSLDDQKTTS